MITNNSKAPSCTCPSGDGSLVHPCPAHPASVKQAGGGERAAFEAWATHLPMDRQYLRPDLYMPPTQWAWDAWQARAALAQPSPKCATCNGSKVVSTTDTDHNGDYIEAPCPKCGGTGEADSGGVHPWGEPVLIPCDCETEKAEAERPVVVARLYRSNDLTMTPFAEVQKPLPLPASDGTLTVDALMTVAQHERIVEARWNRAMDLMGEHVARISEKFKAERDAAQARVAELEMILRELNTSGLMQFSTADEEKAVRAALSGAQAQHSAGYAEARQCVNCRHIGINDSADYAACHDCNWTGPEPDEDKCPGCAGENCMAAACPECGGRYDLVAEANITAPAGQVPQAWLDVQAERRRQIEAEGWTPEHDDEHSHGQMARAAACYALAGSSAPNDGTAALLVSLAWPWDEQWWKPSTARRDMVKACALGLAEIERLDRVAASQGGPSDA